MPGPKYWPVALNGVTYQEEDFLGNAYVTGLPAAFHDFVMHAAALWNGTSASAVTLGTGTKNFSTQAGKPWLPGSPLRISAVTDPTGSWMDAVVTAYNADTGALTVESVGVAGSGSFSSWNINAGGGGYAISGLVAINQGGTGASTPAAALANLQGIPTSRILTAGLGLSGGGDMTNDRSFAFASAGLSEIAPVVDNDWFLLHALADGLPHRSRLSDLLNLFTPAGIMVPYAGSVAPSGWYFARGQSLLRTTDARLFNAIGVQYGAVDGSHFSLPDVRGRVMIGLDDGGAGRITAAICGINGTVLGAAGGNQQAHAHNHSGTTAGENAAHQHGGATDTFAAHAHGLNIPRKGVTGPTAGSGFLWTSDPALGTDTYNGGTGAAGAHSHGFSTGSENTAHAHTFTTSTAFGGGSQNVQPSIVTNVIIKA